MDGNETPRPIDILLVEDDPGDVLLTKKALQTGQLLKSLNIANDGVEALSYLRKEGKFSEAPSPDLILLDLNMPQMDGREVLAEIKQHPEWKRIPVVVLTTSDADKDIIKSYDLQASCYVTKPVSLGQFKDVVNAIQDFWLSVVKYPAKD